jgi:hypothetical protein
MPNHIAYIAILIGCLSSPLRARDVYLNGTDISSAFNQHIKNADIRIDEKGTIYISAPHYQVKEQDTYLPLSKFFQETQPPAHQNEPKPLNTQSKETLRPSNAPTNAAKAPTRPAPATPTAKMAPAAPIAPASPSVPIAPTPTTAP